MNNTSERRKSTKRFIKKRKTELLKSGDAASKNLESHVIDKLDRLKNAWRFSLSWLMLCALMVWVLVIQTRALSIHYTKEVPKSGGTYIEGTIGPLTNVNPIYASSNADKELSRVLFSGLMRYDGQNNLVGDLADSIEIDDKSSSFIVKLRPGVAWHDGHQFDAQDVVFTVQTIQDPAAKSPLRRSFEDVSVKAIDQQTVSFNLPASFSPFPHQLTFGIIPEHILGDLSASQLRSSSFNSALPIGTGPFSFQRIVKLSGIDVGDREFKVQLIANKDYHLGSPKLDGLTFWVVPNQQKLVEIFNDGQLSGASGLVASDLNTGLKIKQTDFRQTSGVFLFFKTSSPILADKAMRQALAKSVSVNDIIIDLERPYQRLRSPLLDEQVDYDPSERAIDYNAQEASAELDTLGWLVDETGFRSKDGQRLSFSITTQADVPAYQQVLENLQVQFAKLGVEIKADYREAEGFAEAILADHSYSHMLLYGINIGVDPDVYSFWHSSQADRNSTIRLNLSEYQSDVADKALDLGRSRSDPAIRQLQYQSFLNQWHADVPAIAIYRPTYIYYSLDGVVGPRGESLRSADDRLRDVHQWSVLTTRQSYF